MLLKNSTTLSNTRLVTRLVPTEVPTRPPAHSAENCPHEAMVKLSRNNNKNKF